ncbi:hypothetical protein KCU67_g16433, partial [Aureobasidium melanogenum]
STQQQVVVLQQQMRMQQMAQLQQNAMQGENSNMEQRSASPPMPNSNHALQDAQMQLMLLEQQNKKRLSMSPIEKDSVNPSLAADSGMPGRASPAPGPADQIDPLNLAIYPAGMIKGPNGQMIQRPSLHPAFAQMTQQQQMDMFRQAQARNGQAQMANGFMPQPGPMIGGQPPPQPPEMGITRDHDGQMKQPPSLHPAFTRMNQQQMPPLHHMTSLSSDNRHRRRLRTRTPHSLFSKALLCRCSVVP